MKRLSQRILTPEKPLRIAMILSFPLLVLLGLLTASVVRWEQKSLEDIQRANMNDFSHAFYNHIVATDVLEQSHGGIYVEVIQHMGASHTRNALSIMGRDFVKINPSMITNQLIDLIEKRNAYQFHITSLQSSSKASAPDRWETQALKGFNTGKREESAIMEINNKKYFRYIAPLPSEKRCRACHRPGPGAEDPIIGGLSLVIPLEPTDRLFAVQVKKSVLSFAGFGIFITLIIIFLTLYFSKQISVSFKEITDQQKILKGLNEQLALLSARDSAILASIEDGIAIISDQGVIEHVNSAFTKITAVPPHSMIGKRPEDIEGRVLKDEIFSSDVHREFSHNGRVYIVDEVPVYSTDSDKLLCSLRLVHDATDEKLSAALELAGATAHEVRQPLAIMLSMTDLIREEILTGKDVSDELAVFDEQLRRIDAFISKTLKVKKYQTKTYTEDLRILDVDTPPGE